MKTALDTNVLSSLLANEPNATYTVQALDRCRTEGALLISPVVFAELLAYPGAVEAFLRTFFETTGINVSYSVEASVWDESGRRFAKYAEQRRRSMKESPRRLLADFVIGSHALATADRLMTLDQNFYKKYFPELRLL